MINLTLEDRIKIINVFFTPESAVSNKDFPKYATQHRNNIVRERKEKNKAV